MYVFSFSSHYLLLIYFIISNSQNANNNAFPELRNSYSAISDSETGYLFVRCLPSVHPTVRSRTFHIAKCFRCKDSSSENICHGNKQIIVGLIRYSRWGPQWRIVADS